MFVSLFTAIGTLVPYIPVLMKELGLSSTETGILYGLMPFISFFTRPLFGAVADKLRKHKLVLVICLLSMGLFYGLLLVTPSKNTTADCAVQEQSLSECILNKTQYHCFQANKNGTKERLISLCTLNVFCNNALTQNVSDLEQERIDFTCFTGTNVHCHSDKTSGWMLQCYNQSGDFGKTFVIFFIIYLFANISFSSIYNLLDAMAYNILDERRDLWGRQRLWGTVGFAIFALVSSFITGMRSEDHQLTKADYSISFYIFIGLCVISAIVVFFLRLSESIECKHLLENVTYLLRYPEVVAFMIVITFIGIFFSVIQGFLFWYLRDIGSTQLNLGLCILTNSIAEIAMLAISGRIIKHIGHAACLYIALASYAARFLSFSFITSPWIAPVIELLHGFCFGLMYDAASEYASIIAPVGMAATVQGLIGGLYFGFGKCYHYIPHLFRYKTGNVA